MNPLLLAAVASMGAGSHTLATDYGRERTLRTTSELQIDMETTVFEMKIDGRPPEDGQGPGRSSSSLVRKCVVSDRILEGEPSAARHLKRMFETLRDETRFSFHEEERSDTREFPLQGVTLELTRDGNGGVQSELSDGPKPDDKSLLEGHALQLALDAFLPEGAVELGASWELDDAAVKRGLATALDAKLFADQRPDDGEGERVRGGNEGERRRRAGPGNGPARSVVHVEWRGKAKLAALEEEQNGIPCVRIDLELEGQGELPEPSLRGPPRRFALEWALPSGAQGGRVKAQLEGSLFFSTEKGRPVSFKLDGDLSIDTSSEHERDDHKFSMHSVQTGRLALTIQTEEGGS